MRAKDVYIITIVLLGSVESSCASDMKPAPEQPMDVAVADSETSETTAATCGGHWITRATGSVVDEAGNSIADARPQLCLRIHDTGQQLCLAPPLTDDAGQFDIQVPDGRCVDDADQSACLSVRNVVLPG